MRPAAHLLSLATLTALFIPVIQVAATQIPETFQKPQDPEQPQGNPLLLDQQPLSERQAEANRLRQQGFEQYKARQFQAARESLEQALVIYRDLEDRKREGQMLGSLGIIHSNLGQYRQAISYYEQQLLVTREIGDRVGESDALGTLSNVYQTLGDDQQAINLLEQALSVAREIGDRLREGSSLNGLGVAYKDLGNYWQAIAFYEQALAIYREIDELFGEAEVLGNLGVAYGLLGDHRQAINLHEQQLALHEQQLAITGDIYHHRGLGRALSSLGNAYYSLGNYQQAIGFYEQGLAVKRQTGDRHGEGNTLANLGRLFDAQEQPELAIVFLKASVEVRESIRSGMRDLDPDLQKSYLDTVASTYRLLADLLLQQDRIMEAQRVLDLLKVQELDDYIRGVERTSETEAGVDFLRPEETILARYDALQESAIAAGQELEDLKAIPREQRSEEQVQRIAQLTDLLDDINGDFRDFARSPEILKLIDELNFEAREASLSLNQLDRLRDELQQLNAAIFYPLILDDRLELVITVPDSPPLRRTVQVSREELNAAILEFRTALTHPGSDAETPAQQLYDWLIRPLEADLGAAGVETLIYSPDGQLRYIPLAALHDGEQWLIQQYRINNITAESLTDLTESDTPQPSILAAAYADPSLIHEPEVNGTSYTFQGLPGAGAEVATLPTETKFLDEAFSLDSVRPLMDEYSILHFATHAAFVPGVPEDSFILFGNGDTPTLRDVEDWSLNGVELVVLSACETGVGGLGNGEEILGLGYQFQVSGARAVMSSLWKVSDQGTQVLMTEFYAALGQGMTKAEALQRAQQALIANDLSLVGGGRGTIDVISTETGQPLTGNNLSHPYYWASFILIGNGL
ncbi:tetratricopeptide repeat domain protein [Halomicronema hongdechloris C2206]|uniref:Tetratricopeptide repeat domain protein n=1 Tax=Halomicronema hongdechloris C2206 TaxID=1641165 RepID=A0A1Z3HT75_9CYAN|nr:CHAT domain-containing protein [Halomicronema hongdechloris]ASC73485.1 tetratricopeptide repeat domain protein [Halomicronema hongdechloris C2206]